MSTNPISLSDRFRGCLIGLAVGDALGSPFEGFPASSIAELALEGVDPLQIPAPVLFYTDDTQMMFALGDQYARPGDFDEQTLVRRFAQSFDPDRGYGAGMRRMFAAVKQGGWDDELASSLFPGGSLGNGGAMRVAPVGLLFRDDLDRVAAEAERSSRATHRHPIGVDGARLIALAVALATRPGPFRRPEFFDELRRFARTDEFRWQVEAARDLPRGADLAAFGNGVEAHRSVVTALASFANAPDDYLEAVGGAIRLGGDADTIAAMTGAIAGARLGLGAIPAGYWHRLENNVEGRDEILRLADRLLERHQFRLGLECMPGDLGP